jgi:RNA polymerase sigma-54 factor
MNDFSQRLDLKQAQTLVMTPQLQQAIKMLQLTNVELSELIDQELEHNPLLEKVEGSNEESSTETDSAPEKDSLDEVYESQYEGDQQSSSDFDAGSSMATVGAGGNSTFDTMDDAWENNISTNKTLREHLNEQVKLSFDSAKEQAIAMQLIDRLDERGFLRQDQEELLKTIGCKKESLTSVLETLKQFDPTGVFAKDLVECFSLQLIEKNRFDPAMKILLENLTLLAAHDHKKLQELCGVNGEDLREMIEEVRALNPHPASQFDHFVVQTAIPDVLMRAIEKSAGGGWKVILNHETLPKVLINEEYQTIVQQNAKTKEDKNYVSERIASANWLIRAMDQRAQTILKVASAIIEKQYAFFLYGVEYLTPLTLREIAEEIEMHESTVSRVTTSKYIGTPRGIFELKYFFSSGVSGSGGNDVASEAVKAKIKNLIDKEEKPKDVLSDDKIGEILAKEGIDIARRTVAKYREAMHYGSSVQRRKVLKNKTR